MSEVPPPSTQSALLSFRGENITSFRDEFELSFLATSMSEKSAVRRVPLAGGDRRVPVLPVAGILGANASGKSNVLKAINQMRLHVEHSFVLGKPESGVSRLPFKLDEESTSRPTSLEIDVVIDSVRHVYGFSFDDVQYLEEWAEHYPKGRPATLFRRTRADVAFGPSLRTQGSRVASLLRPNALFLSTAAATNFSPLRPLYSWLLPNLRLAWSTNRRQRQMITIEMLDQPMAPHVLDLIRAADLGIASIRQQEPDAESVQSLRNLIRQMNGAEVEAEMAEYLVRSALPMRVSHRGSDHEVEFEEHEESLGTLIWIGLLGQVVRSLSDGLVLLVDELDGNLHPLLVEQLLRLFQDPETNPRGAQMVFTTHNTSILGDTSARRIIGRDQVWFSEKDADGSSRLYSLADSGPRKEEAIERRYLTGRYGAVPILARGDFAAAVNGRTHDEEA